MSMSQNKAAMAVLPLRLTKELLVTVDVGVSFWVRGLASGQLTATKRNQASAGGSSAQLRIMTAVDHQHSLPHTYTHSVLLQRIDFYGSGFSCGRRPSAVRLPMDPRVPHGWRVLGPHNTVYAQGCHEL